MKIGKSLKMPWSTIVRHPFLAANAAPLSPSLASLPELTIAGALLLLALAWTTRLSGLS